MRFQADFPISYNPLSFHIHRGKHRDFSQGKAANSGAPVLPSGFRRGGAFAPGVVTRRARLPAWVATVMVFVRGLFSCALPHSIRLAPRQGMTSRRKWADFLPAGKDFTIAAANFLPVGNGRRGSVAKVTKRHDDRGRRAQPWSGRITSKGIVPNPPASLGSCPSSRGAAPKLPFAPPRRRGSADAAKLRRL